MSFSSSWLVSDIGRPSPHLLNATPRVVLMQATSEFDWQRTYSPDLVVDYSNWPLAPIHAYFLERYRVVATIDGIGVLVPKN